MVEKKETAVKEAPKFKGRFVSAIGRRKQSIASVRLYKKGEGLIVVNSLDLKKYFPENIQLVVKQPLKQAGLAKDVNLSILVRGGGKTGQSEAIRHGIARALVEMDEAYKKPLKAKGWLTRDARVKERKKPGLKKARRAPQWSKR